MFWVHLERGMVAQHLTKTQCCCCFFLFNFSPHYITLNMDDYLEICSKKKSINNSHDVIAFSFLSFSQMLQVLLNLMSAGAVCTVAVRSSVSLRTTTRSVPATGTALSTLARPPPSKHSSKGE